MEDALDLKGRVSVRAAEYPDRMDEHPVNRLVCPECYWQVRYVRGELRTYFKHDTLTGNGRWKSCSRYKAGEQGGGDGGWHPPTWHTDDHPTIHQVINGFVIHTLAKEHGWLGSDSQSYNACLDETRHYRLRPENRWADLIEEATDRPRWNGGATVAELVFVRYLTGTADTRPEPPTPFVTTPFRQVMALGWAAAGNRMRAIMDLMRDAKSDDGEMGTAERMLTVLTAPGNPSTGWDVPGRLGPILRGLLWDAAETCGVADAPVIPASIALSALVVSSVLGVIKGLEIDVLLTDPSKVIPTGGFVYVASVWRGENEQVGVKVGMTLRMPEKREAEHLRNSAGAVRRFELVRFASDAGKVETMLITELIRRNTKPLRSLDGKVLGREWFQCSLAKAETALKDILASLVPPKRPRSPEWSTSESAS